MHAMATGSTRRPAIYKFLNELPTDHTKLNGATEAADAGTAISVFMKIGR